MKKIKGINIPHLGFQPLKLGDFLYYEGPLLSHFVDKEEQADNYFYRWVDCDDTCHRWLIFKATEKGILAFLEKKYSLFELIVRNPTVILLDMDDDLQKKQILVTTVTELPDDYLPEKDSFFDAEFYQDYAIELQKELSEKEKITLKELSNKVSNIDLQQKKVLKILDKWLLSQTS